MSMNNILPRGRFVHFDLEEYIYDNEIMEDVRVEDDMNVRAPDMEDA